MEQSSYGYVRVVDTEDDIAKQLAALEDFGIAREQIFVDQALPQKEGRAQFNKLLRTLRKGDVVAVPTIACLGQSCAEVAESWEKITVAKKADVVVLDTPLLDTRTTPYDMSGALVRDVVLQLLGNMDQIERACRSRRQAEGIASARERGVHMGRPAIERPDNYAEVWEALSQGEITRKDAAAQLGVSLSTADKWFKESKAQDRPDQNAIEPDMEHAQKEDDPTNNEADASEQTKLPLDRKPTRGKLRWYLVRCTEGEEARSCKKALSIVGPELMPKAFVPRVERRAEDGSTRTLTPCLFGGYFIAVTADAPALAKRLAQLVFPAHMAGAVGNGFAPMGEDTERFIAGAMDQMRVIRTSQGTVANSKLQVHQGPLAGQESRVLRVDRERNLAHVRVGTANDGFFTLLLPLEVAEPAGHGTASSEFGKEWSTSTAPEFLPYDEEARVGEPRWYLAACPKDEEEAVCADILRIVPKSYLEDAFVPRCERQRKYRGEWKTSVVPMFTGYLVVVTRDANRLNRKLSRDGIAARLVGGEAGPAPICLGAQEIIEYVMDEFHTVRLSTGEIVCAGERPTAPAGTVGRRTERGAFARARGVPIEEEGMVALPGMRLRLARDGPSQDQAFIR